MEELKVGLKPNKEFTTEELIALAKNILNESVNDFNKIKTEPWYKKFIHAIVFTKGREKLALKNVKNLSDLQCIFLKLYETELKKQNTALNEIVEDLIKTQKVILKIYRRHILKISDLGNIDELKKDENVASCLVSYLTLFRKETDLDEEAENNLKIYNNNLKKYLGVNNVLVFTDINPLLESIKNDYHDTFYRCALEQCMVTNCYDENDRSFDLPDKIAEAIYVLSVSPKNKHEIETTVIEEMESFGKDSFLDKYNVNLDWIDLQDLELVTETEEVNKEQMKNEGNETRDDLNTKSYDKVKSLILGAVSTDDNLLGKEITIDAKLHWLFTILPFIIPKTIITVTKGANSFLVFTTYGLYLYIPGGVLTSESLYCLPYEKISVTDIGTDSNQEIIKLVFIDEDNTKRIFSDNKINMQRLENLLLEIAETNEFAKSDRKLNFDTLNIGVKIGFFHIISAILLENKHPLFELYRGVVDAGLAEHWEKITTTEDDVTKFIVQWQKEIPYPLEEAIALRLVTSICKILQYTKQNELLTANEKKYFRLILNRLEEAEIDEAIKNQIICAQIEKKFIESRLRDKEIEILYEYIHSQGSKYGITSIMSSTVIAVGLTVVPLGWIYRALTYVIAGYLTTKKIRDANKAELKEKLYKEIYLSYRRAIAVIDNMNDSCKPMQKFLNEALLTMQSKTGCTEQYVLTKHGEVIEETVKLFLKGLKKKYCNSSLGEVEIANELDYLTLQKILSQMTFSLGMEDVNNVIGLQNGKLLGKSFVESMTGNYTGILYTKNGFYLKADQDSPIKYVMYTEIQDVAIKGMLFEEVELILFNGKKIKLNGLKYKDDGCGHLFETIAKWNHIDAQV